MANSNEEVRTQKMIVKPDLAKKWIAANSKSNRSINPLRVDQYCRDMKEGQWAFNGESIKFSAGGTLVDGQHRLLACIQAGIAFETNVIFGLHEDAIFTIDSNMVRTTAQMLRMTQGTTYATQISGALSWLWKYTSNQLKTGRGPSRHEALGMLREHPGIESSVKRCSKINLGPPSVFAFCHYLFSRQDQTLADAFFDAIETGEHMKAGDPVYLLRERLIQRKISRAKMPMLELIALFFKSWQQTKLNKPMKLLRWQINEDFPSIEDDLNTGVMWRRRKLRGEKTATV